ncbi:MAG: helix-turn-helix domain-containing protein [Clostridia bacterium]|nr:helix-turn-helix domain-containing protein [Clostridia bacterium]
MQNLQTLIEQFEKKRKIHISIVDLDGILSTPITSIDFKNALHSKEFCNIAKSTESGYRTCLRCKLLANTKALKSMTPFVGQCSYGLQEAAVPVVIEKSVAAIVYVGNAVVDTEQTKARIQKTCERTKVSPAALFQQLNECECIHDLNELYQIGDIVAEYLKLLYDRAKKNKKQLHWLVSSMKLYADKRFCYNLSLKELAITYQKNEQYLGRLFKKHMGVSFHEYCMQLRMNKAEKLLLQETDKVIDIAFECGFNNISYFNRTFREKYGVSPIEYRKKSTDYQTK